MIELFAAYLDRLEELHSDMNSAVKMITEGMEMIIVVVWKNVATLVPMPVRYMWCAQTINERNPRKSAEYTRE